MDFFSVRLTNGREGWGMRNCNQLLFSMFFYSLIRYIFDNYSSITLENIFHDWKKNDKLKENTKPIIWS